LTKLVSVNSLVIAVAEKAQIRQLKNVGVARREWVLLTPRLRRECDNLPPPQKKMKLVMKESNKRFFPLFSCRTVQSPVGKTKVMHCLRASTLWMLFMTLQKPPGNQDMMEYNWVGPDFCGFRSG
jgi:hypothetical protein